LLYTVVHHKVDIIIHLLKLKINGINLMIKLLLSLSLKIYKIKHLVAIIQVIIGEIQHIQQMHIYCFIKKIKIHSNQHKQYV
jgi:hypothetical protein